MKIYLVLLALFMAGTLYLYYYACQTNRHVPIFDDTYTISALEIEYVYHTTDVSTKNIDNRININSKMGFDKPEYHSIDSQNFAKIINLQQIKQNENNIFFIETSCSTKQQLEESAVKRRIHLNRRQCCSIESAALMNKNHTIYILHTCPLSVKIYEQSPEYIKQMLLHPNIYLVSFTLDEVFYESPIEDLYHNNNISSSLYPVEHLSDVLRVLTLWKFGGTYLDSDTITIRNLDKLMYNYAGLESDFLVGNAVLNFKYDGIGHRILTNLLHLLKVSFNGDEWSANGPDLITKILLEECNFIKIEQLATQKCPVFTIYSEKYFYSLYYYYYEYLFEEVPPEEVSALFKDSYIIHFWNKLSKKRVVTVGSNQLYGLLADKYCPGVYHNSGTSF